MSPYRPTPPRELRFPKPAAPRSFSLPLSIAFNTLVLLGCLLLGLNTDACSGVQRPYTPPEDALVAIHVIAHGIALADHLVAPHCGVASPSPACATFVVAYGDARGSLILAEQAAQDWQRVSTASSECHLSSVLTGAQRDVTALLAALDSMHVTPPTELATGAVQVAGLIAAHAPACGDAGGL